MDTPLLDTDGQHGRLRRRNRAAWERATTRPSGGQRAARRGYAHEKPDFRPVRGGVPGQAWAKREIEQELPPSGFALT